MNLINLFFFIVSMIGLSSCEKEVTNDTTAVVNVTADVTIIAGSANDFELKDNSNPLNARFYNPKKMLWQDKNQTLYILDGTGTTYLRKLDQNGLTTVSPYTFDLHSEAFDIAQSRDAEGSILVTTSLGRLMKLNPSVPISASNPSIIIDWRKKNDLPKVQNSIGSLDNASIDGGYGLAVIDANTLFFSSSYFKTIRKVDFSNVGNEVTEFAGKSTNSVAAPAWPFANGTGLQATFGEINDMTSDLNGNIYVADPGYMVIRKITTSGQVSSFLTPTTNTSSFYIDMDGTLNTARASNVKHVAVSDDSKKLFFSTSATLRLVLQNENRVITIAKFKDGINGIAVTPDGNKVFISSGYAIYTVTNIKY